MNDLADFARDLATDIRRQVSHWLVAFYLDGSAALGDFNPPLSDIDLLVIVDDGTP